MFTKNPFKVLTMWSVNIKKITTFAALNKLFDYNFWLDFVRKSLPANLMPELNDFSIDRFLNTWSTDNRVRALIMQPGSPLRLRYALIALEYRHYISFG